MAKKNKQTQDTAKKDRLQEAIEDIEAPRWFKNLVRDGYLPNLYSIIKKNSEK